MQHAGDPEDSRAWIATTGRASESLAATQAESDSAGFRLGMIQLELGDDSVTQARIPRLDRLPQLEPVTILKAR